MPITSTSGAQSSGNLVWAQLQQQQAQRNADQAEQKARALQDKARDAQAVADQAQENARSTKVSSDQAQGDAREARQGLVALKSLEQVQSGFSELRDELRKVIDPTAADAASGKAAPVVNSSGQTTGTLVNVTA